MIQTLILVRLLPGLRIHWPILLLGLTAMSVIFVLTGLIAVLRAPTLNAYLITSVRYVAVLFVPLILYIVDWNSWVLVLHPMYAPLVLLRAATEPAPAWEVFAGVVFSTVWIGLLGWRTQQEFQRFVRTAG